MISDLTCCITSFKRASYLDRAIKSVLAAGIDHIVVSTMEPDSEVCAVLAKHPHVQAVVLDDDLGCNELWLQAVYRCQTKRLIVLHDDDTIAPELGQVYQDLIKPAMDDGSVEFCSWRAHLMFDDGRIQPTEWFHGETRKTSSGLLRDFLLKPGRLSLSPIISIFDRDTLIGALKEAHQYLTPNEACLLHSSMLLGSEIIAYLRHCATFGKWMYINQVLSHYGCCDSSGTVKAQKTGDLRQLTTGYDVARNHFRSGAYTNVVHEPRILFVYDDVQAKDEDEQRRFDYAMFTWKHHFNQGDVLEYPTHVRQWIRSSADLEDPRPVPFFKDLIEWGMAHARSEDTVMYCNRDTALTTLAPERIIAAVKKHGVAVAWRRNVIPKPGRLYKHVTNAKRDGGVDAICISPSWWNKHNELLPDMLLGRECHDWCFRIAAEELHGRDIYVDDVLLHEPHTNQFWKQHKKTNPGQLHNRAIARVFFAKRRDRKALVSLQ